MSTPPIDPKTLPGETGTDYPAPYDELVTGRERRVLGDPFGLTQFGVNMTRLPPGQASAQRHWHRTEDEFVIITEGVATLITDAGPVEMTAGMVCGFPAGKADGHHLVNNGTNDVWFVEVGTRAATDRVVYPDIDMIYVRDDNGDRITRRDGTSFEEK